MLTFAQVVLPSLRSSFERSFPDSVSDNMNWIKWQFSPTCDAEIDALTYDLDVPSDLNFSRTSVFATLCDV